MNIDDELISLRDEIDMVYNMLMLDAGYDIGIAGVLWVRRYEHPMWAVEWESDPSVSGSKIRSVSFPIQWKQQSSLLLNGTKTKWV